MLLWRAKAANYIALGDSYSAGENGDTPESGAYQSGISDADSECRRWDQAYPYVFNRYFLKNPELAIDVTFKTFACTGAITHNIYNPADLDGDSLDHLETNRPSHPAPGLWVRIADDIDGDGRPDLVLETPARWEPRQAVSLATAQQMREVDTITLTIGGNDVGFAAKIRNCALVHECDPAVSDAQLAQIEQSIVDVLAHVKEIALDAAASCGCGGRCSVGGRGEPASAPEFRLLRGQVLEDVADVVGRARTTGRSSRRVSRRCSRVRRCGRSPRRTIRPVRWR